MHTIFTPRRIALAALLATAAGLACAALCRRRRHR